MRALPTAPHRMMFLAGALSAAVSGPWWLVELAGRALPSLAPPAAVVPLWAHSWLMLFGLYGPFIMGFLFTTFPRWQSGPQVPRGVYVPVFALFMASVVTAVARLLVPSRWNLEARINVFQVFGIPCHRVESPPFVQFRGSRGRYVASLVFRLVGRVPARL